MLKPRTMQEDWISPLSVHPNPHPSKLLFFSTTFTQPTIIIQPPDNLLLSLYTPQTILHPKARVSLWEIYLRSLHLHSSFVTAVWGNNLLSFSVFPIELRKVSWLWNKIPYGKGIEESGDRALEAKYPRFWLHQAYMHQLAIVKCSFG